MKSEAELKQFYEATLKPQLEPLEQYRMARHTKLKRCLYAALCCGLLIVLGFFTLEPFVILNLSFPSILLLSLAFYTYRSMSGNLQKQFKNNILPLLLEFLFDEYEYKAKQRIADTVLEKSMLFHYFIAGVQGEDFMRFKIGETNIMFCETTVLTYKEKIKFMGVFIVAVFNKSFTSNTLVLPKSFSSFFVNMKRKLFQNMQNVKLEDVEFDNEFTVLSTDQVEARYILTTSFMQRIMDYKRKTKEGISFSFVDNKLYCAIPEYVNLFEPALFEPFDFDFIKKTYSPLKLYTGLVDDLHLNLRIWSKQ
jgi:hypothetical protein